MEAQVVKLIPQQITLLDRVFENTEYTHRIHKPSPDDQTKFIIYYEEDKKHPDETRRVEDRKSIEKCKIEVESVAQALAQLIYFILAFLTISNMQVELPSFKLAFNRETVKKCEDNRPAKLQLLAMLNQKHTKQPPKYHHIKSLYQSIKRILRLKAFFSREGDHNTTQQIENFQENVNDQLRRAAEQESLRIQISSVDQVTDICAELQKTNLVRTRSLIYMILLYSPLGWMVAQMEDKRKKQNQQGGIQQINDKYFEMLIRIKLERDYQKMNHLKPKDKQAIESGQDNNNKLKLLSNSIQSMFKEEKNKSEKGTKFLTDMYNKVSRDILNGNYSPRRFFETNVTDFFCLVQIKQQFDIRTSDDTFWLFRRRLTFKPEQTASKTFKLNQVSFIIGYSQDKIVEVVLVTDIAITMQNFDFALLKTSIASQSTSLLDLAIEEHPADKPSHKFVSVRLSSRYHSTESVLYTILMLMDLSVATMMCLRQEFKEQTVDDYYLSFNTKFAHKLQHYIRLMRRMCLEHYLENPWAKALLG